MLTRKIPAIISGIAILVLFTANVSFAEDKITYDDHVKPVFQQRCFSCHNGNKKEGDLDLTNYTNLMQGGGSGTVIEPGDAGDSYLFSLVSHKESPEMPPETDKIPAGELDLIKKWIDLGALETKSSVAKMKPKKKVEFAIADPTAGRPENPAMPATLLKETDIVANAGFATTAIATSPWAPLTAIAGHKQVVLYHSQSLELLGVLPFPEGQVNVLQFSRNGSLLLAAGGRGGANGRAVLFDVRSGRRVANVGDKELEAILAADVSADHSLIAVGGPERLVRIYSTETGQMLQEIKKHTDWITAIEFSPDGILVASGDRNGGLHVWESATAREYLTLKNHSKTITAISWRVDSNVVASASEDTTIRLWELENGNEIKNWGAHGGGVSDMLFSRDGRIVSCGRDRVTKVFDQNGAQQAAFPAAPDIAVRVSICNETNRVISADWSGKIEVFNVPDQKPAGKLAANPPKLQARLAGAQNWLKQITATSQANAKIAVDTQNALTAAQQKLAAAQKMHAEKTALQTQFTQQQAALNSEVPKLAGQVKTLADRKAALEAALPNLKTAREMADQANAKLGDENSKKAAAQAATTLQQREAELTKVIADLAPVTQQHVAKKAQLDKVNVDLPPVVTAVQQAKKTIDQVTPTIKPLQDKATQTKQTADHNANQVKWATASVQQHQAAIDFAGKYKQLESSLAVAEKVHVEKFQALQQQKTSLGQVQGEMNNMQTQINTAQANLKTAQELQNQRNAAVVATEKAKTDNDGRIAALKNETAALAKQIPLLEEAADKFKPIADASPNDKEVAEQLAAQLALIGRRKQRAAGLPKLVADAEATIPNLQAAIQTAKQQVEAQKVVVVAAQKAVTDAEGRKIEIAKRMSAVQGMVQTAQQATEQANAGVQAVKKQISTLQGIQ